MLYSIGIATAVYLRSEDTNPGFGYAASANKLYRKAQLVTVSEGLKQHNNTVNQDAPSPTSPHCLLWKA